MPEFRFPVHPLLFQFPVFLRKEVLHFLLLLWKAHPLPAGKEFPFLPPEGVQLFLFLFIKRRWRLLVFQKISIIFSGTRSISTPKVMIP